MKLIDKYLLRSLLVPLMYCLAAFVLIYVIYDLYDHLADFVNADTPLTGLIQYYVFLTPSVLVFIVPISLLLAVLYSLSSLTKNNELTAMRASGVSLYRLLVPFVIVGLLFTLAVSYINETFGPHSAYWCSQYLDSQKRQDEVDLSVVRDNPFKNELRHRIWMIKEFNSSSYDMTGVSLTQEREDGSRETEYTARSAAWMDSRWWFRDLTIQHYDEYNNPRGAATQVEIMEMVDLDESPKNFINEMVYNQDFMSAKEIAEFVRTHPNLSEGTVARYKVDYHYRRAIPWLCFVVTLLGIPMGSETGRRGAFLGVLLCISLFFALWVAISISLALGKKGTIEPGVAGWAPILLFTSLGIGLLYRMR